MLFRKKREKIMIMPYRGYASDKRLILRGRVLEDEVVSIREEENLFHSLRNAYKRFESDEIPLAGLVAQYNGRTYQVTANKEGYFLFDIDIDEQLKDGESWNKIQLKVTTIPAHSNVVEQNITATGEVMLPAKGASFGIISDIDDTVLKTDVSHRLKLLRNTLLKSPFQRLPLPGVANWLKALKAGKSGQDDNPIFYISKSPRNLYDYLAHFLALNNCPKGPILLRDIGWIRNDIRSKKNHHGHKKEEIISILETYPHLPFVFLGDIAGKDPEIYNSIRTSYKERVLAIFIRDIAHKKKQKLYRTWINSNGIDDIHLIRDSVSGAKYSLHHGLITPSAYREIQEVLHHP
ncbi:MAG: DUF2183 domain-containing protein [Saprospiraceae bacterium]|nr:DUF2183 domain-containing protein [Saprospiraceae bacterium]